MPIYEYTCRDCGGHTEEIVPSSKRDKASPCGCGGKRMRMASLPYVRPEGMYYHDPIFGRIVKNDADNPWEGSGINPPEIKAKQTKIQVDLGADYNVGADH